MYVLAYIPLNQLIIAPSSPQPVDSDADAAHGVENGPINSEADITTNSTTTTTVLTPACLNQVRPNETTSWWNHLGWASASTSTGTTSSTLTRPLDDVAVTSTVANASQEFKPTTPSTAIGNVNARSATVMGLSSAESGMINEAGEGKSAEPTENARKRKRRKKSNRCRSLRGIHLGVGIRLRTQVDLSKLNRRILR